MEQSFKQIQTQSLRLQDVRILNSSLSSDAETESFQTLFIVDKSCVNFYKHLSDSTIVTQRIETLGERIDSMVRQIKLLEVLCATSQVKPFLEGKIEDIEVVESIISSQVLEGTIKKNSTLYYL